MYMLSGHTRTLTTQVEDVTRVQKRVLMIVNSLFSTAGDMGTMMSPWSARAKKVPWACALLTDHKSNMILVEANFSELSN